VGCLAAFLSFRDPRRGEFWLTVSRLPLRIRWRTIGHFSDSKSFSRTLKGAMSLWMLFRVYENTIDRICKNCGATTNADAKQMLIAHIPMHRFCQEKQRLRHYCNAQSLGWLGRSTQNRSPCSGRILICAIQSTGGRQRRCRQS
jgi:hypothetical protein